MHYWQNPYIKWQKDAPENWDVYIFQTRTSRNKALTCAIFEALSLFSPCQPIPILTGPLADKKGSYRLSIPSDFRTEVKQLAPHFGYTEAVHRLGPLDEPSEINADSEIAEFDRIRWRKKTYTLRPVYIEPQNFMRHRAPDKRHFRLLKPNGEVTSVLGYRGDGQELSRRGLPAEDARLMLNLARPFNHGPIIDPFAGVGGILYEAADNKWPIFSGDIDPKLRYGLGDLCQNRHTVQDSVALPYADGAFTAVVSELPFDPHFLDKRAAQLAQELTRIVPSNGKIVLMTGADQIEMMKKRFADLNISPIFASPVNRKGTDVHICVWQKI